MTRYAYGMRLRGFSPGAQPRGVLERQDDRSGRYYDIIIYDHALTDKEVRPRGVLERQDDRSGRYYDIIIYDHALTDKEVRDYELDYIEYDFK